MSDHVAPEIDWAGIPIDDQLLDHLATEEGCWAVWKDSLDPLTVENEGVRDALEFVLEYMHKYRVPPDISVLSEETGYPEFREPIAPIGYVIEKLRDDLRRKELRRIVSQIGRKSGNPEDALSYGLRELATLQSRTAGKTGNLSSDDMLTTLDRYDHRNETEGRGISFGYPEIDARLGGLRLNELAFVLGRPKRYKSWQLLKSADTAWACGETPVVQTMEMSSEDMLDRWTCMRAGVSWSNFKNGTLNSDEIARMLEAEEYVHSFDNRIHFLRPDAGNRNVAYLVNSALDVGGTIMYIDQLSWFDDAKSDEMNWLKIGKLCEQMKDAAAYFPIYCAAQLNREAANLGAIADLTKVGLSDMIGQTADILMGLYASSEMLDQRILHFGVVESRSFEHSAWELKVELSENSNFRVLKVLDPAYS